MWGMDDCIRNRSPPCPLWKLCLSVRDIKSAIGWKEKKPLHFRDLSEKGKHLVINGIADNSPRLRVISVFLHKPSLNAEDSAWYQEKHRVYFYLVRFLMERIS